MILSRHQNFANILNSMTPFLVMSETILGIGFHFIKVKKS